jgi:hypothetical protein
MDIRTRLIRTVLPLLAIAACAEGEASRPVPADELAVREVTIHTRDFVFDSPDTLLAGLTSFRLVNDGPDFHHVLVARLEEGHTVDELAALLVSDEHAYATLPWLTLVGGPNTPGIPGGETNAIVDLEPGEYVLLCVIPAPDGQAHTMKGMIKPITVVGENGAHGPMPAADVVMVLDDFSFDTDREIRAGRRTIRIENIAAQPHEVLFVRLEPGRTAMDFLEFLGNPQGAPPGTVIGGNTPIDRGEVNLVTLDFEPGEYALLCFVPDAGDMAPHFAHGMVSQITVR